MSYVNQLNTKLKQEREAAKMTRSKKEKLGTYVCDESCGDNYCEEGVVAAKQYILSNYIKKKKKCDNECSSIRVGGQSGQIQHEEMRSQQHDICSNARIAASEKTCGCSLSSHMGYYPSTSAP